MITAGDDADFQAVLGSEQGRAASSIVVYRTGDPNIFPSVLKTDPIVEAYMSRAGVPPVLAIDAARTPKTGVYLEMLLVPELALLGPVDPSAPSWTGYRWSVKQRRGVFTAAELDEFAGVARPAPAPQVPTPQPPQPQQPKPESGDAFLMVLGIGAAWWFFK